MPDPMTLANHHLDMARLAIDSMHESPDDVPAALVRVDRLIDKTEVVAEALYQLGERLDPCQAVDTKGRQCGLRRHYEGGQHRVTVGENTYAWTVSVKETTGRTD